MKKKRQFLIESFKTNPILYYCVGSVEQDAWTFPTVSYYVKNDNWYDNINKHITTIIKDIQTMSYFGLSLGSVMFNGKFATPQLVAKYLGYELDINNEMLYFHRSPLKKEGCFIWEGYHRCDDINVEELSKQEIIANDIDRIGS